MESKVLSRVSIGELLILHQIYYKDWGGVKVAVLRKS